MSARHSNFSFTPTRWLCVGLAALAILAWGRGLQMARDRTERLMPARATSEILLGSAETITLEAGSERFLLLRWPDTLPAARLALRQVFPERQLLRWLEPQSASASSLILPLEGLDAGEYWLVIADPNARAAPEEMDRPVQETAVLARLRLR